MNITKLLIIASGAIAVFLLVILRNDVAMSLVYIEIGFMLHILVTSLQKTYRKDSK